MGGQGSGGDGVGNVHDSKDGRFSRLESAFVGFDFGVLVVWCGMLPRGVAWTPCSA